MRTSLLALGGLVGLGSYLVAHDAPAAPSVTVAAKAAAPVRARVVIPTASPRQPSLPAFAPVLDEVEFEASDEMQLEVSGLQSLEDDSEFAMVFDAGDHLWMRIGEDAEGVSGGRAKFYADEIKSVIAPVSVSALPTELRRFDRMNVLVDGTCAARVDGFAKIARAAGEAGGGEWDDEGNFVGEDEWTLERVEADGYILAARLDGDCDGTWARSTQHAPAVIADLVDDPELLAMASKELLAHDAATKQTEWTEQGGEGAWQDAVSVTANAYIHPGTGEVWVFASATKEGGCGDPGMSANAAYRVAENGSLTRVADLEWDAQSIRQVVDLNDDGEVELVLETYAGTDLVDLTNETHRSISVQYHSYGCGC